MGQLTFPLSLREAAPAAVLTPPEDGELREVAIGRHRTAVDTESAWNGPAAVSRAPGTSAVLRHMHAIFRGGDGAVKANYALPHHAGRSGSAANVSGVNNALARLSQVQGVSEADRRGAERHLRGHRRDAGLEEAMGTDEMARAVAAVGDGLALSESERTDLASQLTEQEHDWALLAENLQGSWEDLGDQLRSALRAIHGEEFRWTEGTFADRVVYWVTDGADRRLLERTWSVDDDGDVTLGDPREVKLTTTIEPVGEAGGTAPQRGASGTGTDPEPSAAEAAAQGEPLSEYVPLLERAVRSDGTIQVKVIAPGWGNSGYYSQSLLERDGPQVFTPGTKMYVDHPTRTEERDRPERSLKDLAATLTTPAAYLQEGPDGPGLYSFAKVFGTFKEILPDLAPHIGVSIRAYGQGKMGEAEGRKGRIIERIVPGGHSVDFVTAAGAGGKVLELYEAARGAEDPEGEDMGDAAEKLTEAEAERDEWKTKAERAHVALLVREARDVVGEGLSKARLPEVVRTRLLEQLSADPPVIADGDNAGNLDRDKLVEAVKSAVADEVKYLAEATGAGKIRGMGGAGGDSPIQESDPPAGDASKQGEDLEREFARMGLSESAAKAAVAGRA